MTSFMLDNKKEYEYTPFSESEYRSLDQSIYNSEDDINVRLQAYSMMTMRKLKMTLTKNFQPQLLLLPLPKVFECVAHNNVFEC